MVVVNCNVDIKFHFLIYGYYQNAANLRTDKTDEKNTLKNEININMYFLQFTINF